MPFIHEISPPLDHTCHKISRETIINQNPLTQGGYGEFSYEIDKLIHKDRKNIAQAVIFFSTSEIKLTENVPALTKACQQLIRDYKHLFEKEEEFQLLWNMFTASIDNHLSLRAIIPAPITTENPSGIRNPEFNLETMAYHSYRHANEMYRDTYKKCMQLQFSESTCRAAATMAYFHDLVQKVDDPFPTPPLGKNEIVTTQLLNFIIDNSSIDPQVKEMLKCLSSATILGGTFLIKTLTPLGEKRNVSLSKHIDDVHKTSHPLFKDALEIIKKIRHILAENDVSRTLNPSGFVFTESIKHNPIVAQLTENLKKNATSKQLSDARNKGVLEEHFGAHLISRLFQSIRFLAELNRISVKKIRDRTIPKKEAIEQIPTSFIDKLKLPSTWTVGEFSEMAFAKQSQHTDYVNMLKNHFSILINANTCDIADLIFLALTEGQDGNFIDILKEIDVI